MVRSYLVTLVASVFSWKADAPYPEILLGLLAFCGAGLAVWWMVQQSRNRNRRVVRSLNELGEQLLASKSHTEALKTLRVELQRILTSSSVRLFKYDRNTETLGCMETPGEPQSISNNLQTNRESPFGAAIFAFQNRTLLTIPDALKSPLLSPQAAEGLPRGLIYVPTLFRGQPIGILEIAFALPRRRFNQDVQICLQHLGNQVAAALRLIHQQSIQEQLVRSEKLATAGQLVSGIAAELSSPLASILQLTSSLLRHQTDSLTDRSLRAIATHVDRATGIVQRLSGFSRVQNTSSAGELDLAFLLREMLQMKDQVETNLADLSVIISGNRSQLEQVFLDLLGYVEQQQDSHSDQRILVGLSTSSQSVLIRIEFPTRKLNLDETEASFNLDFCRGIFNAHNGNIKLVKNNATASTFEIELPLAQTAACPIPVEAKKCWTVLVIEPEGAVQRKLLSILSLEGHRVVPVVSAEEAADLLERMRFHVVFCDVRLPGRSWIEFYESVRYRPITFVLVTEGFDEGLSRVFEGSKGFLLRKPLDDSEIAQLLRVIESGSGQVLHRNQEVLQS